MNTSRRRAGGQRLLHRVLDERLVDDRQHLLRARLGGGQEARAAPGHRKHGGADHRLRTHPHRDLSRSTVRDCRSSVAIPSMAHCEPPRRDRSGVRSRHAALTEPRRSSVRSAHLKTAGRMLSQERHFGQRQYQPTLCRPQSSH